MNACVRAVVRTAISHGLEVMGIRRGYAGLISGDMVLMTARSVSSTIQQGGTILQTARCPEFLNPEGRQEAVHRLNERDIEGLVIIGGNGSLAGAYELHKMGVAVIGVPSSIDNDIYGTDMAIGVDTALNTMVDAIDKIKDTASSHNRAFLIQVMGRKCGYLALVGGIVGGAEVTVIPEKPISLQEIATAVKEAYLRGKSHAIIVIAEGAPLSLEDVANYLRQDAIGFEVRSTVLGHVQRGGTPTAFDRILATRLGVAAVEYLRQGVSGKMVGLVGNQIVLADLQDIIGRPKELDLRLYELAEMLAR